MDKIGIKKNYSSLKMDNITVINLKDLAKQGGIKLYYKLRKAELIQNVEAYPYVNEQVLIPGLDIPRNTTTSVNTSAILDEPKACKRSKILVIGCWITYHQYQKWLTKPSNRLKM